jgi:hypothetical protein
MKPIASFRVYPGRKTLFFKVIVWGTAKDLRRHLGKGHSRTDGACLSHRILRFYPKGDRRKDRLMPCIGEIHLHKGGLGVWVISHELTHALLTWMGEMGVAVHVSPMKRINMTGVMRRDCPEEVACYAMGGMMKDVYQRLYKLKLI